MDSVVLTYGSSPTSKTYKVLGVRGADDFDEIEMHNAFQNTADAGELFENFDSWRRIITIEFNVMPLQADRTFLFNFMFAMNTKVIEYNGQTIEVVSYSPDGFQNEWIDNIKTAKKFTLRFKEKTSLTTVPAF